TDQSSLRQSSARIDISTWMLSRTIMTPLEELAKLISEKGRKILVAENPVDLRTLHGENSVFILQLPEGSSAAGGRAGGFGERRLSKLYCFHYAEGACRKLYEVDSA